MDAGQPKPERDFAAPDLSVARRDDGAILIASNEPLGAYDRQLGAFLRRWADATPDAVFMAHRNAEGDWIQLTYARARDLADAVSQALLDLGLSVERPLAVLSDKSIGHGLIGLAAMQVGIPYVPVSPAFSLKPEARARLTAALEAVTPGLVYVEDGPTFADVLPALAPDATVVHSGVAPEGREAIAFHELTQTPVTSAVDEAFDAVAPDDIAKVLFTSGSTGAPKPAINTHRNLCSNVQALRQVWPFLTRERPVVVDWQPWHHCGGGNFNLYTCVMNGGSYYCDHGRPTPSEFAATVENLRGLAPTIHFNVPLGYELLADALEADAELRESFFSRLKLLVYSGAAMPPSLWKRYEALAGRAVPMVSAYGMTEMGPLHTIEYESAGRPGLLGAPVPGCEVKLVESQGRYELRGKGPNIAPGYFRRPDLDEAAFDEDGFFITGDAVAFVDPADPNKGLAFDGRLVEEFKLISGTWVPVGEIRVAVQSAGMPLIADAIVVGEGEARVGLLVVLDLGAARHAAGDATLSLAEAAVNEAVHTEVAASILAYNDAHPASSRRIGRALLLDAPPSLAAGETTDKGYINQRRARTNRTELIARLFSDDPGPDTLVFGFQLGVES